jgi:tripeptide aminopeptidase
MAHSALSMAQILVQKQSLYPQTATLLAKWPTLTESIVSEALTIQAIPAPTFNERIRAVSIHNRFGALGLRDIHQDDAGNVLGRTPGADPNLPALLICAHLDTVFSEDTDLTSHYEVGADRAAGAGLGDNSLGLAALVALAYQITTCQVVPACDIWWVATTGEEGLGDLRGMRCVCNNLMERLGLVIVIEGLGFGRIYHAGLGSRRLRVEIDGPGGHSWLHSARPSAIHHLLKLGAQLVDQVVPSTNPRASFNIGLISGGTSINTRAPNASLSIDLRSTDGPTLMQMESYVRDIIARYTLPAALVVKTEIIGDRPNATLSTNHPLVQTAQAVLNHVNWGTASLDAGSTDANIPLAMRIPSVCVGITTGGNAHTTAEYIDIQPIASGMQQLTLLALLASEHMQHWKVWVAG